MHIKILWVKKLSSWPFQTLVNGNKLRQKIDHIKIKFLQRYYKIYRHEKKRGVLISQCNETGMTLVRRNTKFVDRIFRSLSKFK